MNEISALVGSEPNDVPAGRLVEMWVRSALTSWYTHFPGRRMLHDESMRLLAWDMVGTALAYADWDALVSVLMGEVPGCENVFTMTLYRCILNHPVLQQQVGGLLHEAVNRYACADALREWFEVQVDSWVSVSAASQLRNIPISALVTALIENAYGFIFWEHVARAFRPGY